ncbi:hypothetical protein [Frankia sp. CiP3]|uniref:hypothetical protein n=1 Tax=Frankia sp. CiP3 TaxID=2880971 RepID=UPI001EF51EB4|nr:hypothetical protein [Frankia sp. CiP3]
MEKWSAELAAPGTEHTVESSTGAQRTPATPPRESPPTGTADGVSRPGPAAVRSWFPRAAGGSARPGWRQRVGTRLPVAASYLLLAFGLTGRVWSEPTRNIIAGNPNDTGLYCWWLAHTAHAVTSLSNPFITHLANAPEGINALWNTSVLAPGLLLTPLTIAAGPVASYNVLIVLAFALSALGAQLFARKLGVGAVAAYVGGYVYGFSPALVAAGTGHLSLVFAPAIPLLLCLITDIIQRTGRPLRKGILLGTGAGLQLLTGEEVLFITAVTAILGLTLLMLSRPGFLRNSGGSVHVFLIALPSFLALTSIPLGIQFLGSPRSHGSPFLTNFYKSDLTALYVPSSQQLLASAVQARRAASFQGGAPEYMSYLGWPLLILCLSATALGFRDLRLRIAGLTGLALAVLTLGSTLLVNGVETGLLLPWNLVARIPVFDAALPDRFALGTALMAGLILAIVLDLLPSRLGSGGSATAVVVAAVCVLPLVPRPYSVERSPDVPSFFTTNALRVLPANSTVLLLPYPSGLQTAPLFWQTAARFHFSMPGGYFIGPGDDGQAYMGGRRPTATAQLLTDVGWGRSAGTPALTPAKITQAWDDFIRLGVRAVVLGPAQHAPELRDTVTFLVGRQPRFTAGVYVWLLP